jgi:hypothetical protein
LRRNVIAKNKLDHCKETTHERPPIVFSIYLISFRFPEITTQSPGNRLFFLDGAKRLSMTLAIGWPMPELTDVYPEITDVYKPRRFAEVYGQDRTVA